jgi:hypothetical protein
LLAAQLIIVDDIQMRSLVIALPAREGHQDQNYNYSRCRAGHALPGLILGCAPS